MTQFLQLDVGGQLHHDLADLGAGGALWDSSPAPTVILYHRSGGELRASATATTGSSYTLSSAASVGATSIALASTTGVSRWEPLVIIENGAPEHITPKSVSSGTVALIQPLKSAHADGATVRSPRLSATVAASVCASVEHGCRAEWRYSIGGVARRESTSFTISRYVPRYTLTSQELLEIEPRAEALVGSYQDLDRLIDVTWSRKILPDVAKMLGTPGAAISGDSLESALLKRVLADLAVRARDFETADRYEADYAAAIDEIRTTAVDLDESGGQSDDEIPRSRNAVRILRG